MDWAPFQEFVNNLEPVYHDRSYDPAAEAHLQDAVIEKRFIEREQNIARFQFRLCFLENGQEFRISLRQKFQLLAKYYLCTNNERMFVQVVRDSIVREWVVPIDCINDFDATAESRRAYWDRAPLYLAYSKSDNVRKDKQTYRIRILALEADCIGKGLQYGCATTYLYEETNGSLIQAKDSAVLELDRQGGTRNRRCKNTEANGDNNSVENGQGGTSRKRKRKESLIGSDGFECSFKYTGAKAGRGKNAVAVPQYDLKPKTRNIESFTQQEHPASCVTFDIRNIGLVENRDVPRTDGNQKYSLCTALKLHYNFNGNVKPMSFSSNDTTSLTSMPFQAAHNASIAWKNVFPFIWSILVDYHTPEGTEPFWRNTSSGESENGLPWRHVFAFVRSYIGSQGNVKVRELTSAELRTVQAMILTSRLYQCIKSRVQTTNYSRRDRDEIENAVFGQTLPDFANNADMAPGTYIGSLQKIFYHRSLNEEDIIWESDFTSKCVSFYTTPPKPSNGMESQQGHRELSFSLYKWLHGVEIVINGSHLHSVESRTTIRLFNRQIISLRSGVSAKQIMGSLLSKSPPNSDNVILIRFDERAESRLSFEFAEQETVQVDQRGIEVNRKPRRCFNGAQSAQAIEAMSFPVDAAADDDEHENQEKAEQAGVLNKKKMEASGLFAFLKSSYPSRYTRVFCGVVSEENGQGPRHQGKLVSIFGLRNERTNPVYDFTLNRSSPEVDEIDPVQGPPGAVITGQQVSDDVFALSETMSAITVGGRNRPQQLKMNADQIQPTVLPPTAVTKQKKKPFYKNFFAPRRATISDEAPLPESSRLAENGGQPAVLRNDPMLSQMNGPRQSDEHYQDKWIEMDPMQWSQSTDGVSTMLSPLRQSHNGMTSMENSPPFQQHQFQDQNPNAFLQHRQHPPYADHVTIHTHPLQQYFSNDQGTQMHTMQPVPQYVATSNTHPQYPNINHNNQSHDPVDPNQTTSNGANRPGPSYQSW